MMKLTHTHTLVPIISPFVCLRAAKVVPCGATPNPLNFNPHKVEQTHWDWGSKKSHESRWLPNKGRRLWPSGVGGWKTGKEKVQCAPF